MICGGWILFFSNFRNSYAINFNLITIITINTEVVSARIQFDKSIHTDNRIRRYTWIFTQTSRITPQEGMQIGTVTCTKIIVKQIVRVVIQGCCIKGDVRGFALNKFNRLMQVIQVGAIDILAILKVL